jgi:hypothetical protein
VLVLLAATTAAFVVTERLKLRPTPITKVAVTNLFSPTCECETAVAAIAFQLRRSGRMTLEVVDRDRRPVRTLLGPTSQARGPVNVAWDGRTSDGRLAPDGVYGLRVRLGRRTIYMPNRIHVDTTAPAVHIVSVTPRVVEPGRTLRIRYRLSEPARVSVFLDGRRRLLSQATKPRWKVEWQPRLRPGRYRLTATARDPAGNVSAPSAPVTVVSPFQLVTRRVRAVARSRFRVRLRTDGRRYVWRLGPRNGVARTRMLRLRAPRTAGRYRVVITQDGVRRVVPLVVTRRPEQNRPS